MTRPTTANTDSARTDAEQAIATAFDGVKDRLPGAAPVSARRAAAFETFAAAGLPTRRVETWKYTDLRALMREAKPLAQPPGEIGKVRARAPGALLAGVDLRRVVIADGVLVKDLSDLDGLEPGLSIGSLADALTRGDSEVTGQLGAQSPAEKDVAFALNTAFMGDGAVIRVAPGARIARPIHLVFCFTGPVPAAVYTRSLVSVGAGAAVTLVESHEGPDGLDYQINTALDLVAGDGAEIDHVKIGLDGASALHVATLTAALGPHVRYNDLVVALGGAAVRNQFFVRCDGSGIALSLNGATMLKGRQHADATLVVDHAIGGCVSREIFKGVLDGESRSVFQGKIVVRPDAQKTDGKMASHALLLSETAEADHKPELEIFADDVVCGHGATAGSLDEDLLFYLMARGIPKKEAETLLIQSFVGEAIDTVTNEGIRDALTAATSRWLEARE
ncbi:Fe-S cluster assembly protein SufD [Rhodoplanes elegans]|uniref:Fe-S cluster assembly protein SufD n=1 Tax=Rhodoplanes elegans TaxID=29408 RepID=UPI0019141191|nr:Fe-S cluster assembly protein SufD [Rhodoplanes elegans]MBK5957231.1 Fe-S cluster assembly protein SufD [Rhodoplanes elegans]